MSLKAQFAAAVSASRRYKHYENFSKDVRFMSSLTQ